ncbi:MAG: hypothetical protein ACREMK_13965 [Gemmatimonadota bacterium]
MVCPPGRGPCSSQEEPIRLSAFVTALVLASGWSLAEARAQSILDVQVLGFADIDYVETDRQIDDGFFLGQLVGHAAAGLSEHVSFFTEVSATARQDQYRIEVERLILRYDFSDALKVSAGRYHTPINYWNTAFHHGLWLQTTVSRPEMIRFGARFQPVHFVGLQVEGSFPATPLGVGYSVGLGNGRSEDIARAGDPGDVNNHRAWLGQVYVRPPTLFGLQAGAAFYLDRVRSEEEVEAPGEEFDERIFSAHLAWLNESPEFIGEYARVFHEPEDGDEDHASDAWYAQLAYRLPGRAAVWKPYARYERIEVPATDPVFAPFDLEYEGGIAGVRYDFTSLAALKVEYRRERFETSDWFDSLYLQLSLAFGETGGQDAPVMPAGEHVP